MKVKEIEKEYLEKNSIYNIENSLLSTLSNSELKEFSIELYDEYIQLEEKLEAKIIKEIKSYSNTSEMDKYFIIEFYRILTSDWQRLEYLESILKKFYNRILRNNFKETWAKNKYVDINSISIVEVIGKYINIPNNLNRNIRCPLHNDKTASFRIYTKTNSFYCFWCKKGGNAINFIAEINNLSIKDAFKLFCNL